MFNHDKIKNRSWETNMVRRFCYIWMQFELVNSYSPLFPWHEIEYICLVYLYRMNEMDLPYICRRKEEWSAFHRLSV